MSAWVYAAHRVASLAVALVAAAAPALADVYSFNDEDGTPRFSNVPDDPRYKLFLKEPRESPPKSAGIDARQGRAVANPALQDRPYHQQVKAVAEALVLDPALIHAVIEAESRYNPNAVSERGAIGLMQVMPTTGQRYGVSAQELRDPARNIATGARYLTDLLRLFNGDLRLALAGYNAGEAAVARHGNDIPPYAETKAYVPRVLALWQGLQGPNTGAATSPVHDRPRTPDRR
jgi:soluble lytic murein transglycosylase-like protein